jgi:hypothetical protein
VKLRRNDVILLAFLALTTIAGFGALGWHARFQEVWFLNGFEAPILVEVSGERVEVPAQGKTKKTVTGGLHHVRVLDRSGRLVEEAPAFFPTWTDVVVYNALGAAPVYEATKVYARQPSNRAGNATFRGGARVVVVDSADYVFVKPPGEIRTKRGADLTKKVVDVAPGGVATTVAILTNEGRTTRAAELVFAANDIGGGEAVHRASRWLYGALDHDVTLRWLDARRSRDDADEDFAYAHVMYRLGRGAEVLAEYRQRYAKNPESARHGATLARIEEPQQAKLLVDALISRFPKDPFAREAAVSVWFHAGDHARVAELGGPSPGDKRYPAYADDYARSLVTLGRIDEAAELLFNLQTPDPAHEVPVTIAQNQIVALSSTGQASKRAAKEPFVQSYVSSVLGEDVSLTAEQEASMGDLKTTLRIHVAALKDPASARDLCAGASVEALGQIHTAIGLLLAGELERLGDGQLAAKVMSTSVRTSVPGQMLLDYMRGGPEAADLVRLDPEVRAALDFLRSRFAEDEGTPADALREAAQKRDILRGPVSIAMTRWPKVGGPEDAAILKRVKR